MIPYLPFATVRNLVESDRISRTETLRGSVLFIDVAGFTPMCLALASEGAAGIQALQEIMSRYYSGLLDFVRDFGGVVYQFAGDSILVGMRLGPDESDADAAVRAARCVTEMHSAVDAFADFEALGRTYTIQTKAGAGFGEYHSILLGQRDSWFYPALVGPAVEDAVGAEVRASGGQTLISGTLMRLLPNGVADAQPTADGEDFYELRGLDLSTVPHTAGRSDFVSFQLPQGFDQDKLYRRCTYFLQDALIKKITTGHRGFTGDLRNTTSLFVRFEGLDYRDRPQTLATNLGAFFRFVQSESRTSGGLFLQADFTDKGGVFLILFGAPTALENKEAAAARLALRILKERARFEFIEHLQAGLATGDAYCGDLGAPFRKSYSVLGENVNVASRLATFTGRDDYTVENASVFADAATQTRLPRRFTVETVGETNLKGISAPVKTYRILGEKELHGFFHLHHDRLIGRRRELAFLKEQLDAIIDDRQGRVVSISGEAGVGKSRLVGAFMEELANRRVELYGGHCFSYERHTPLFPWKELLLQVFEIDEHDSNEARLGKIEAALEPLADVSKEWALALGVLLGFTGIHEKPLTRSLDAREKNLRLSQIVCDLVRHAARENPVCLYFEDAHWMDETSFKLIEFVVARIRELPVIVLLSLRPDPIIESLEQDHANGALATPYAKLELGHLEEDDAREFVRHRLRLNEEHGGLEDTILQVAQGNPFFIESIVDSLVEQGHIQQNGATGPGGEDLRELATEVDRIQVPNSLKDVLLARLDGLDENAKTTLKTASVIGRVFAFEILRQLLPDTLSHDMAEASLIDLERIELTRLETPMPLEYIFKHVVIRDVAYESMLLSTREFIHRRLARHLETLYEDNLRDRADTLAYHFLQGKDSVAALRYTMLAGDKARDNYANRDAIAYYEQAESILSDLRSGAGAGNPEGDPVPSPEELQAHLVEVKQHLAEIRSRIGEYESALNGYRSCFELVSEPEARARLHLGMGLIYQERGEPREAVSEMEQAMKLYGKNPPRTKVGTIVSLLGQFFVRFLYQTMPFTIRRLPKSDRERNKRLLQCLRVLEKMYFLVDLERFAWGGAYGINLAERVADPGELAQFQAAYGMIMNGMGAKAAARRYLEDALELARKSKSRNPLIEGLILQLNGTFYMFWDDPEGGLEALDESIRIYRGAGGMWELLTSLGTQGQLLFLLSRFKESQEKYEQCGELAEELNSAVHLGWRYCKASFCKFLTNEPTAELVGEVRADLYQAIALSVQAEDLMNHLIATAHLATVARMCNDADEAARLAAEVLDINRRYKVNVPHVKIALVDAADAALFAVEHVREHGGQAGGMSERDLFKLAAGAWKKARALGKTFPYLRGPAERARAWYVHLRKGPARARSIYEKAIEYLDDSPHRWECAQAYAAAARAYPEGDEKRLRYLDTAREICMAHGIEAELSRLRGLMPDVAATS